MELWPGHAAPLGATYDGNGTNFALFSEVAERVELCLLDVDEATGTSLPHFEGIPPREQRAELTEVDGHVWHGYVPGIGPGTRVAVVPVGYGDGVPRAASSRAPVLVGGVRRTIAGRVCMDQFVLDVGDDQVTAGDRVVLFGDGTDGGPTAQDWAEACGTISYEIVTRIGGRFRRRHVGEGT